MEEFGKKTTHYYDGSKDNLIYRSASYKVGALTPTATLTLTLTLTLTPTPTLTRCCARATC